MTISGIAAASGMSLVNGFFAGGVSTPVSVHPAAVGAGAAAFPRVSLIPYTRESFATGPLMAVPAGYFLSPDVAGMPMGAFRSEGGGMGSSSGGESGGPISLRLKALKERLSGLKAELKKFDLSSIPRGDRKAVVGAGRAIANLEIRHDEARDIFTSSYLGGPALTYARFNGLTADMDSGGKTLPLGESGRRFSIERLLSHFQNSIHVRRDLRVMRYYFLAASAKAAQMQINLLKEKRIVLADIWAAFEAEMAGEVSRVGRFLAEGRDAVDDGRDLLDPLDLDVRAWIVLVGDYAITSTRGPLDALAVLSETSPPSDNYMQTFKLLRALEAAGRDKAPISYNGKALRVDEFRKELYYNYSHLKHHLITLKYLFGAVLMRASLAVDGDEGGVDTWNSLAGDMRFRIELVEKVLRDIS